MSRSTAPQSCEKSISRPARNTHQRQPDECDHVDGLIRLDDPEQHGPTTLPATILMGDAVRDSRDAPVGGFAGTSTAGAETVGSYSDVAHSGREAMGTFAGDADEQRRGGFSDVDRETVTTYRAGVTRVRIASHHNLKQMLLDAGLDEATATSDVDALHHGRTLVLVQSAVALDDVARLLGA
ncbi:MAG: hypothetical protein QOD73_2687 [Solirubrobacteraceae bacterium]|nr:hypothetical protein [Solirubrobacteraceae bacterium]